MPPSVFCGTGPPGPGFLYALALGARWIGVPTDGVVARCKARALFVELLRPEEEVSRVDARRVDAAGKGVEDPKPRVGGESDIAISGGEAASGGEENA